MDVAERQRLEKLLGMLGSTFDGERANAARMIAAMAERKNITIPELVLGAGPRVAFRMPPDDWEPPSRKPRREKQAGVRVILDALQDVAASEEELEFTITAWEFQFAVDVSGKYGADYELSEKQLAAAQRIIEKVEKTRERARAV